jgi:hypothetical protein
MTTKITGANIDSIANTGVKWNAVTVADGSTQLSASAGNGYFLDTNTGVIEVILPSSPTRGDTIILADYAGNFSTNNVIVRAGSNLIDSVETAGAGQGYTLSTNNLIVELVYVDSTKGWMSKENEAKSDLTASDDTNAQYIAATGGTVTTSGDYKIHTFTGDGNFVVSSLSNPTGGPNVVDYLVVAGGGSGGARNPGNQNGGGGGGGVRESKSPVAGSYTASPLATPTGITVTATTFPITVGAGGAGKTQQSSPELQGNDGSNSVFSTITSTGGGGGGGGGNNTPLTNGRNGGSGGGAGGGVPGVSAGSGNTPPVSPPQGSNGGIGGNGSPNSAAGGGGGATEAGQAQQAPVSGRGGAGATTSITGSPVGYGGGGGGSGSTCSNMGAASPCGSGGKGSINPTGPAGDSAGETNRGGGGGGGYAGGCTAGASAAGGKGVVIIRYKFQN